MWAWAVPSCSLRQGRECSESRGKPGTRLLDRIESFFPRSFEAGTSGLGAYGFAIAAVFISAALRLAMNPFMAAESPFVTFYSAVVITTIRAGMRAGFLSVALSACAASVLFLPAGAAGIALAVFTVVSSFGVLVIGTLGVAIRRYRELNERYLTQAAELDAKDHQQRLLAAELDHRAKNVLAVVQAIVQMTSANDPESFAATVSGRIRALARSHDLIAHSAWQGAAMHELVGGELAPFSARSQFAAAGPDLLLRPAAAQALAMVFHELSTNAIRHGSLSRSDGTIAVTWTAFGHGLEVIWKETGGPWIASPPVREGLGSRLIRAAVEQELGGRIAHDWRPDGLVAWLSFPLVHDGVQVELRA